LCSAAFSITQRWACSPNGISGSRTNATASRQFDPERREKLTRLVLLNDQGRRPNDFVETGLVDVCAG
jgi:hypothetical protein